MKTTLAKCPFCRTSDALRAVTERFTEDLEHDGRAYQVTVPDLSVQRCDHCGQHVIPNAADDRISAALRAAAGLLMPVEIRTRRTDLGLSQKQLADILKVAEATVCRWETGGQIQQRGFDTLLRGYFAVPQARDFLVGARSARPDAEPAPSPG